MFKPVDTAPLTIALVSNAKVRLIGIVLANQSDLFFAMVLLSEI